MLKCFCRERGSCDCNLDHNDSYHFCTDLGNPCICCVDATLCNLPEDVSCQCVMYPASTENSPAYLIGKDERQLDL